MFGWFRKKEIADDGAITRDNSTIKEIRVRRGFDDRPRRTPAQIAREREARNMAIHDHIFQRTADSFVSVDSDGMDSAIDMSGLKSAYQLQQTQISDQQQDFYGAHSFIGFQMCAIMSQNWIINKICSQPASDAVRNGYQLTVNDGTEVDPEILKYVEKLDKQFRVKSNLREMIYFGRMFGIRVVMFDIEYSDDPQEQIEFYENPFNPDGIKPGSYKGIVQIDPYWITPELGQNAAAKPGSINFMEPTWWRVQGRRIHRSHLIIFRGAEVPDVLKPSYIFSGLSIPQMIYERVYCAERTANEVPALAASKREMIYKVDLAEAMKDQGVWEGIVAWMNYQRSNFSLRTIGKDEEVTQIDTSLTGLNEVMEGQYALACAVGGVPVSKIMGITPKGGLGSEGAYDEGSYREELESIEEIYCTPMIERHHLILMRSHVMPNKNIAKPFEIQVEWNPLDVVSHIEQAQINLTKAQTGVQLAQSGAIDGAIERERIIADKSSGYNGLASLDKLVKPVAD